MMRSATMKDVEGGMSQCIAALLRLLQPLFEAGATLDLAEGCPRLLIFDDIRYIMDEQAIQFCFCTKGASGRKPCPRCRNCVAKSCPALTTSEYFLSVAHACFQDFEEIADHEVFECWDHMAASKETMSKSAFAELEKNTGWRYDAKGLLAQADLRHLALPSRIRFDVLHCFFQTGICSVEVGLFKKNWEAASKSWADLVEMVASLDLTVPASDSAKIAGKCRWLKPACFNEQGVWRYPALPFLCGRSAPGRRSAGRAGKGSIELGSYV